MLPPAAILCGDGESVARNRAFPMGAFTKRQLGYWDNLALPTVSGGCISSGNPACSLCSGQAIVINNTLSFVTNTDNCVFLFFLTSFGRLLSILFIQRKNQLLILIISIFFSLTYEHWHFYNVEFFAQGHSVFINLLRCTYLHFRNLENDPLINFEHFLLSLYLNILSFVIISGVWINGLFKSILLNLLLPLFSSSFFRFLLHSSFSSIKVQV